MRSWIVVFALFVCAVVCVADSEATAKPRKSGPRLDSTFGRGGVVTLRAPSQRHASRTFAADDWEVRDAVADESGRVYVLSGGFGAAGSVLTAYDAQGKLDRDFGNDGALGLGVLGRFDHLALDSAGRVIALGHPTLESEDGPDGAVLRDPGMVVLRVLPSGRLDRAFGTGGLQRPTTKFYPSDVFVDGLGRILVGWDSVEAHGGGPGVFRLAADGTLDETYGYLGFAVVANRPVEFPIVASLFEARAVDATGRFVTLDSIYSSLANPSPRYLLVGLDANGRPDSALGDEGTLLLDLGAEERRVSDFAIDAMGRYVTLGGGDSPFIARFLADGTPDTTWSGTADGVRRLLLEGDSSRTSLSSLTIDGDVYYAAGVRNRRRSRGPSRAVVVRVDGDTEQVWTSRSRRLKSGLHVLDVRDDTVLALGLDRRKGRTKRAANSLVRLRFD